jgi:transcriptional regulator with XRE-family HTH domain
MQEKKSENVILTSVPDKIRVLRAHENLSQKDLGKEIGYKQSQISAYEKGKAIPPDRFFSLIKQRFSIDLITETPSIDHPPPSADLLPPSGTTSADLNFKEQERKELLILLTQTQERLIKAELKARLYREFIMQSKLENEWKEFFHKKIDEEEKKDGF